MTAMPPTLESLWGSLLVRRVRWAPTQRFLDPGLRRRALGLELPALRSRLGSALRRVVCPEGSWQAPCGECPSLQQCPWPQLFPGSAQGLGTAAPLSRWVLARDGEGFLSTHFNLDPDTLRAVGQALDDAFAQALGLDRRGRQEDPQWLTPFLMDGSGTRVLMPLPWGAGIPTSPAPPLLAEGSTLRFAVPLNLKTADRMQPPAMAEWLRLGRNRLDRLVMQNGHAVWPRKDGRWASLNETAKDAAWTWTEAAHGAPWRPVAKHGLLLQGWTGQVHIDQLPDDWVPWASLLPIIGVGSHIPYGCGLGTLDLPQPLPAHHAIPERQSPRIIPLAWRAELVREAGG